MPNQKKQQNTKDVIVKDGTIVEALMNTRFRVELDEKNANDEPIIVQAVLSGKLRKYYIRIYAGDRVRMQFSPHDMTLGRITYRHKN